MKDYFEQIDKFIEQNKDKEELTQLSFEIESQPLRRMMVREYFPKYRELNNQ